MQFLIVIQLFFLNAIIEYGLIKMVITTDF